MRRCADDFEQKSQRVSLADTATIAARLIRASRHALVTTTGKARHCRQMGMHAASSVRRYGDDAYIAIHADCHASYQILKSAPQPMPSITPGAQQIFLVAGHAQRR